IADVSHYVKPGTPLDEEARKRGNSTYLVDRVIPMLPEALSNELCSLKPTVDRLTKCVEFAISNEGRVLRTKFHSAIIHSKRRFTYKEVFAILQRTPLGSIEEMLHQANDLAQKIRRQRFRAGSLDLDFPETKIRLDEQGRVSRIERMENDLSHQLIEEYMLLANEAVATHLMRENQRAIYRVHEEPDERRLQEYREEVLSHNVPCGNLRNRPEVQKLLEKLNHIAIGQALKIGFLRSLMRARYAVEPLGHYGLAKAKYTHFTSPIRRYADLVVHRALFRSSHGPTHSLKETADHISTTERNSADAERDSKDVKLYAFLRAQLASGRPNVYPALVTDLRNFGFFVDVPGLAMSGAVPLSTMEDDFYVYEPARNHLIGRRTRRIIRLGDKLEVQVAKVDSFKKQVDFRLAKGLRDQPERRPTPQGRQQDRRPAAREVVQTDRRPQARPGQQERRPSAHGAQRNQPDNRQSSRHAPRPGARRGPQERRPSSRGGQHPGRPQAQGNQKAHTSGGLPSIPTKANQPIMSSHARPVRGKVQPRRPWKQKPGPRNPQG
ncbi:MAG TPA: VacB/RNase II family 3'-5' exoribonuclease, partial [Candidatus Saccharimonadales bacterium]|nr:VacB/RNase II family 3'-5' exoribonuclease [Candidatus Saccharimonadales bacterium]